MRSISLERSFCSCDSLTAKCPTSHQAQVTFYIYSPYFQRVGALGSTFWKDLRIGIFWAAIHMVVRRNMRNHKWQHLFFPCDLSIHRNGQLVVDHDSQGNNLWIDIMWHVSSKEDERWSTGALRRMNSLEDPWSENLAIRAGKESHANILWSACERMRDEKVCIRLYFWTHQQKYMRPI